MTLDLHPREKKYFEKRRRAVSGKRPELQLPQQAVGLALSGGGIRSATLSLGILRALSEHKLIHKIDILSTVSGGGYTGGFYGSMFVHPRRRDAPIEGWHSPLEAADPLGTPAGEAAIRHLRDNGRYLSSSAGDTMRLLVVAVRAWIGVHMVIGVSLLAIFLTAKLLQASMIWGIDAALAMPSPDAYLKPLLPWLAKLREWLRGYPAGDDVVLSWLWLASTLCLLVTLMSGWAFWLTRLSSVPERRIERLFGGGFLGTVFIAFVCFAWPLLIAPNCGPASRLDRGICALSPIAPAALYKVSLIIGILALGAFLAYARAQRKQAIGSDKARDALDSPAAQESRVRTRLTAQAAWWTQCTLALAMLAIIDSVAQTLYRSWLSSGQEGIPLPLTGGALLTASIPFVRSIVEWVQTSGLSGPRLRKYGRQIALIVAIVLIFLIGTFWATLAEMIAWRTGPIGGVVPPISEDDAIPWSLSSVIIPAVCFLVVAVAIGISPAFLNLSTFGAFYAARLRRAYLGASNPIRSFGTRSKSIEDDDPGDDIALHHYYRATTGAPLHLINVTLNQTKGRDGASITQLDRKGLPLVVSPAGFLIDGKKV